MHMCCEGRGGCTCSHMRVSVGTCTCVVVCPLRDVQMVSQEAAMLVNFWQWLPAWDGTSFCWMPELLGPRKDMVKIPQGSGDRYAF